MRDPEDSAKSARNPPRLVTQDGVLVGKELICGGGGGRPPTDRGRGEPDILDIRSDVELARLLVADLRADLGEVHWCEGRLSSYCGTHWIAYPEHLLRLAAHRYHGSHFFKPGRQRAEVVLLGKTRINSIISELAARAGSYGSTPTVRLSSNSIIQTTAAAMCCAGIGSPRARRGPPGTTARQSARSIPTWRICG